jgi:hypothetical protein
MSDEEFELIKKVLPKELFDPDFKEKALAHFRKILHDIEGGSEEAKLKLQEYQEKKDSMQKLLSQYLKISEDQVKAILSNPDNYPKEAWDSLQEAAQEMKPILEKASQQGLPKKKKSSRKQKWTKS